MINLELIFSVLLIHLLAVISPGPDFFMALKNAMTYSRKTGLYTAIGFGLGIGVHIFYSVFGLALLISKSIILFNTIKYLGVLYILYLGITALSSKTKITSIENSQNQKDISAKKAVIQGFLTNVLNPKASLFFLSLFTLVISPNTPRATLLVISILLVLNTILWFSFVAVFMTQKRIRNVYMHYQETFTKTFGIILIAIGLKIAFSD